MKTGVTLTADVLANIKKGLPIYSNGINEANVINMVAKLGKVLQDEGSDINGASAIKGRAIPKELYEGWDALSKAKGVPLKRIKENDVTLYCVLYKERFGKYPDNEYPKIDHNIKLIYEEAYRIYKTDVLSKMKWDDLLKSDLSNELRKLAPEVYKEKYYQKYGVYPRL